VSNQEVVLFSGRLGTQSVRVWLESHGSGITLLSHDLGPALESAFGSDEIETFLLVEPPHVEALTAALRAERIDPASSTDPISLLAEKYSGNSAATSHFRAWLTEHEIPYQFSVV
jgi:hypothetical protein